MARIVDTILSVAYPMTMGLRPSSTQPGTATVDDRATVYGKTRLVLVIATSMASIVGALLTMSLLAIGLFGMVSGVLDFVGASHSGVPSTEDDPSGRLLEECIRGLELLFLAPLPFLIPVSLGRYIRDSKESRDDRQSKADLLSVKALTTALLVAILASDIVGRALGAEGLHYEEAFSTSVVIAVLALYLFGLERQAREVKAEPPTTEAGDQPDGAAKGASAAARPKAVASPPP
jgi:hypothetical protein